MNDKISMTLSELEKYIKSKSDNRFIYTHENNDISVQLRIFFDSITVSVFTRRLVLWDSTKGHMTETNSNYLYVDSVDNITVEHILSSSDLITIKSNDGATRKKYMILYDYEN